MEEERRKVYVEVDVTHKTDGTARPRKITNLKMVRSTRSTV